MTTRLFIVNVLLPTLVLLSGCASLSETESREAHVASHAERYETAASELLPPGRALSLDDCIRIALERNLDVRAAQIEVELAKIDTEIAFSGFLPRIEASFSRTNLGKPPLINFGQAEAQTSDQRVSEFSIHVQQPIFVPQTWLIHSARKKGEEVRALVLQRVRQRITLLVTSRYYACLSLAESVQSLEQALRQAEKLEAEIRSRVREGLATQALQEEVEVLVLSRQMDLEANRRAIASERAGLLSMLDLPPLAEVELTPPPGDVKAPPGTLVDLVTGALLSRPELRLADRAIDIRRDEVKIAVANFLPKIFGSGGFFSTSDSYLVNPSFFSLGLAGLLTVFDGLKNVREYEAAEMRVEGELLERERTTLAVILQVVEARRVVTDTSAARRLAELRLRAVERRRTETESLWAEGLMDDSDRLRVISERDRARADARVAVYRERVAFATLRDVIGSSGRQES